MSAAKRQLEEFEVGDKRVLEINDRLAEDIKAAEQATEKRLRAEYAREIEALRKQAVENVPDARAVREAAERERERARRYAAAPAPPAPAGGRISESDVERAKKAYEDAKARKKLEDTRGNVDEFVSPANGSPVPKQYIAVSVLFLVIAFIGCAVTFVKFPDMFVPVLVGLLTWMALLFLWFFAVLPLVNKSVWSTSHHVVRLVAVVPFLVGIILAIVLAAAIAHDANTDSSEGNL